jgi:AcrR family transcriptional regulator
VKRKDDAKARDILSATLHEVDARGLTGLSMEGVARRAGVATGTLYVYHASKEALLEAAYLDTKQRLAEAVFRDEGLPVRPAFLRMCVAYQQFLVEHRAEVAFLEQLHHASFLSAAARAEAEVGTRPLVELLERGKRELLLKPLETQLMILFLHGTLGAMAKKLDLPRARARATFEQIAILCWDALQV